MLRPAVLFAGLFAALVACGGSSPTSPSPPAAAADAPAAPAAMPAAPGDPAMVTWQFDGEVWRPSGTPPECPEPLVFATPVDLSAVTSILYPGQSRGGDYKPHGGFRFDGPGQRPEVRVVAPMAATMARAARYLVNGELQHMFDFVNGCGVMHRFDHLRDLSPRLQQVADGLPAPREGDSRTTPVAPGQTVGRGEALATSVGVTTNVFLDWGVYDLRAPNAASRQPGWPGGRSRELAAHAICWFDHLPPPDAARVRSLPPSDSASGSVSDYCS